MFGRKLIQKSSTTSSIFNNQQRGIWNQIKSRFAQDKAVVEQSDSYIVDEESTVSRAVKEVGDFTEKGKGLTFFRGMPFNGQTSLQQPNWLEKRRTNYIDYTNDTFKNEPIPPNIKLDLPCLVGYDNESSVTDFDWQVGTRRAERMNPNVWDELMPWVIDTSDGTGSSMLNPIIIPSMGLEERVVSCPGNCHDLRDDADVEGHWDFWEWYYWPVQENTFAMCDQCGLMFYCASPEVMAQMEYWAQLQQDEKDELSDEVIEAAQAANIDVRLLENLRSFDLEELNGKTTEEREQITLGPLKQVLDDITEDLIAQNIVQKIRVSRDQEDIEEAELLEEEEVSGEKKIAGELSLEEALKGLRKAEKEYEAELSAGQHLQKRKQLEEVEEEYEYEAIPVPEKEETELLQKQ